MYQNTLDGQRSNPLAILRERLFLAVFMLLPLVGLIAGPSYAPLMFGLAGGSTLLMIAERRRPPDIDRPLALIALSFLAVCGLGLLWSILPSLSLTRLGQMVGIVVACLLLLSLQLSPQRTRRLIHLMVWMTGLGVAILALDTAATYPLQHVIGGPAANIGTKYNRGLIYLVLLLWPVMAHLARMGERRKAGLLAAIVLFGAALSLSATGLAALLVGFVTWLVAHYFPRSTRIILGGGLTTLALALPLVMRLVSRQRPSLATLVKSTGLHRLEIWDYMSARILERPVSGWGLGAAIGVPIHPDELATYLSADAGGIYPHNQWIELWLETGLPGVVLALALLWLVLTRLAERWSAYGLAAVASALTVSMLNFEITTDSWWAALAASALLFNLLPKVCDD
jgi:O-antigen ligase